MLPVSADKLRHLDGGDSQLDGGLGNDLHVGSTSICSRQAGMIGPADLLRTVKSEDNEGGVGHSRA